MKTLYLQNTRSFYKIALLFLAIIIISFFTSCTSDELPNKTKTEIIKEAYLQRNDSIIDSSNTSNTTNGDIDPPKPPIPNPTP